MKEQQAGRMLFKGDVPVPPRLISSLRAIAIPEVFRLCIHLIRIRASIANCRKLQHSAGAFSSGNPSGGWFYNPFNFSVKNVANTGPAPPALPTLLHCRALSAQ